MYNQIVDRNNFSRFDIIYFTRIFESRIVYVIISFVRKYRSQRIINLIDDQL